MKELLLKCNVGNVVFAYEIASKKSLHLHKRLLGLISETGSKNWSKSHWVFSFKKTLHLNENCRQTTDDDKFCSGKCSKLK